MALLLGAQDKQVFVKMPILDLFRSLPLDRTVTYSGEHLDGETSYYISADSVQTRILMNWDHGSYGSSEREYFLLKDQLIYYRVLDHGWIDSSRYQLSESTYMFSKEKDGLKTNRSVDTFGEQLNIDDLSYLRQANVDSTAIEEGTYARILEDLSHARAHETRTE